MSAPQDTHAPPPTKPAKISQSVWDSLQEALSDLEFGQVTLLVHNGCVVQIERLERKRVLKTPPSRK